MNQYTLLGEYTLSERQHKMTCDHCGRAIKTVYTVRENTTGECLNIGMVCIGKVMELNTTFEKAVIKELKYYKKWKTSYDQKINIDLIESISTALESNSKLNKDDYGYMKPWKVIRDVIKDKGFYIHQMIEHCERLNKVSKTGLIDVNDLKYYEDLLKEFDDRFKTVDRGCEWDYILDNEPEILELLNKYN